MHSCLSNGDIGELKFSIKALQNGIKILKPISSERYDVVTDYNGILNKVQIKSSVYKRRGTTEFTIHNKNRKYKDSDFDYYALVSDDDVYIIPKSKLSTRIVHITKVNKNNKYLNAWDQLKH